MNIAQREVGDIPVACHQATDGRPRRPCFTHAMDRLYWPPMTAMRWVLMAMLLLCGGCVQRFLTIDSEPSGALVTLNGLEIGRTPMTRSFTWYGNYDVELRKEGYQTLKTHAWVVAPWWQWVPIDLLAEMMPFHPTDHQRFTYQLQPATTRPIDPHAMLERADQLRDEVERQVR